MKRKSFLIGVILLHLGASTAVAELLDGYTYEQLTNNPTQHKNPSINDLGQVVWSQKDTVLGTFQIYGKFGGTVKRVSTIDTDDHHDPSINNKGEIVWSQETSSGQHIYYKKDENSTPERVSTKSTVGFYGWDPSINDLGEIVWAQATDTGWKIESNRRGFILEDPNDNFFSPDINTRGELVVIRRTHVGGGVFEAVVESNLRGPLSDPSKQSGWPSINNKGEIVWRQSVPNNTGLYEVISSLHGPIIVDSDPDSDDPVQRLAFSPSINNLGDLVYTVSVVIGGANHPQVAKAERNRLKRLLPSIVSYTLSSQTP